MIRIALVGRNTIVRESLREILSAADFATVHSAAGVDSLPAGESPGEGAAEIVLMLADQDGDDWIAPVQQRFPDARIVLLSDEFDFAELRSAFQAGVSGYLVRQMPSERLIGSLRLVALGEKVFPSALADRLVGQADSQEQAKVASTLEAAHLSSREIEVLRCLMMGLSNKVVSRKLSISEATVKVHVKAVLRKLNAVNRTQAAIWANSHGLREFEGDQPDPYPPRGTAKRNSPAMPLLPGLL